MKFFTATGMAIAGWVFIWSLYLAITFLADDGNHLKASLGLAHHGLPGGYMALPAVFTFLWGIASGIITQEKL